KTGEEINKDILAITMKIEEQFPELSKYIAETPMEVSFGAAPETNLKNLQDYYETLDTLLKNYRKNHKGLIN
ncbi:MAG: hypothetical protein H7Y86_03870, partial [Rhizobacter sp.]|nr:hypothetical protein [Ferruginibacter sp.]